MATQQLSSLDAFAFRLFQFLDTEQRGILKGPKIIPLFSSSKLPKNLLAHTWEISTRGAKGLNPAQFCLALKIISLSQNGIPVNQMNQGMMADPNIPLPKLDYPPQLAHMLRTPSSQQAAPAEAKPPQRNADPFGFADIMTMSGIGKPSGDASTSPPQVQAPSSGSKDIPRSSANFSALDAKPSLTAGSSGSASVTMRVPTSLPQTGANPRLHQQPMAPPNMFLPAMSNTMMPTQVPPQATIQRSSTVSATIPRSSTVSPPQERHVHIDTDAARLREIAAAADLREKQARKQANAAREENERIVRENQNLKQQIEKCRQAESDALRRSNDVLQKMSPMQVENTQLKKYNDAWKKRSTEQLERNAKLEEEIAKLKTEIQENSTRLNTLTLENQELRKRFESSEELSSKLREQNGQYSKENMELKSKLDQEKRRIEALEFDIKELESRKTGLKPVEDRKQAPVSMDARDTEALLFDSGFKALAGQHGLPAVETAKKPEEETKTEVTKNVETDFLSSMDFTQKKQPELQPIVDIKPKKVEVKPPKDSGNLFPSDLVKTRAAKDAYNGFGPAEVQKKDIKTLEASTSPSVIQMGVAEPVEAKDDADFFAGLPDFGAPVTAPEKPVEVVKKLDDDFGEDFDFGTNNVVVTSTIAQGQGDVNGEPKSVLEPVKPENLDDGNLGFTDDFEEMTFNFNAKPTEKPKETPGGDFVTPGDNFDAADFNFPDFDDDFGAPTEPSSVMVSVKKTEPAPIKKEPSPEPEPEPQPPAPVVTQADKAQAISEEPGDYLKMTAKERDSYIPFFDQADTNMDGIVDGKEALKFFTKSNVKKKILAAIWKLVDTEDSGHLTRTKFYIMMHIVVKYRHDKSIMLPKKLPYYLEPAFVESMGQGEEASNSQIEQDSNIVVPAVLPAGQEGKVSEQSNATAVTGDIFDAKPSATTSPDVTEASSGKKTKKTKKNKKKKKKGKAVSPRQEETPVETRKKEEAVPKDSITSGDWEADGWDVNFDETPGGPGDEKKQDEKFDDFNFDDNGGAFDGGFDDPAAGFDPF